MTHVYIHFVFFINDDGDDDKMATTTITTMFELFSQNFWQLFNETRYFFYLANPYETMFPDMNVPRYVSEVGVFSNKRYKDRLIF